MTGPFGRRSSASEVVDARVADLLADAIPATVNSSRQVRVTGDVQGGAVLPEPCGFPVLQGLLCSRRMEPSRPSSFQPAGAGALLIGTTSAGIGVGALIGWGA